MARRKSVRTECKYKSYNVYIKYSISFILPQTCYHSSIASGVLGLKEPDVPVVADVPDVLDDARGAYRIDLKFVRSV
jgi:hypothetical protein